MPARKTNDRTCLSHDKPDMKIIQGLREHGSPEQPFPPIPGGFERDDFSSQAIGVSQIESSIATCSLAVGSTEQTHQSLMTARFYA